MLMRSFILSFSFYMFFLIPAKKRAYKSDLNKCHPRHFPLSFSFGFHSNATMTIVDWTIFNDKIVKRRGFFVVLNDAIVVAEEENGEISSRRSAKNQKSNCVTLFVFQMLFAHCLFSRRVGRDGDFIGVSMRWKKKPIQLTVEWFVCNSFFWFFLSLTSALFGRCHCLDIVNPCNEIFILFNLQNDNLFAKCSRLSNAQNSFVCQMATTVIRKLNKHKAAPVPAAKSYFFARPERVYKFVSIWIHRISVCRSSATEMIRQRSVKLFIDPSAPISFWKTSLSFIIYCGRS